MKNKERLSLIDDYIKIIQMLKFTNFLEKNNLSSNSTAMKESILLSLKLKSEYEQVFNSINMNDLSMKLLLKDLDSMDFDQLVSMIDVDKKLLDYCQLLKEIDMRFKKKYNEMSNNNKNSVII